MKKFFTLLCMALVSAASFAQDAYNPSEHTAFVSGTDNLCSGYWTSEDAMTYDATDGLWKITLPAKDTKSIELKIVYDGEWYGKDGGSANYKFQVSEASDVLITFDPNTLLATYSGEYVKEATFTIDDIQFITATGSAGLLNGINWKITEEEAAANIMTAEDKGYYTLELKDVAAGSYDLKFAANGSWSEAQWGAFEEDVVLTNGEAKAATMDNGANFSITLEKGATYNVTLTLDVMDFSKPQVTAEWVASGEAPILDDVYSLAGTFNGWNEADNTTELTEVADGVFSITISLEAGEHKFKVLTNHDWAESYGAAAAGEEGDTDGNYVLSLAEASDVTITFNANTKVLTVIVGSATEGGVYAIGYNGQWDPSAPTPLTTEDGNVYTATLEITSGYIGLSTTKGTSSSDWDGFNAGRIAVSADFAPESGKAYNYELGVDASFKISGLTTVVVDLAAKTVTFTDATAIQSIEAQKADGAIYTVAGQRVSKTTRGVYVKDGKKYIVK